MSNNFDLNQLLLTIVNVMLIPILPVLTAYIIAFLKKKIAELESNIKKLELTKQLELTENAISTSIAAVNTNYVDSLKKNKGALSLEEQRAAFTMAKEKIDKILGQDGRQKLSEFYRDVDTWMDSRIEFHVRQAKK